MRQNLTCGKGLAHNALLPAKLGELTAAMAEILEIHMKALDLKDPAAKKEHEAYQKLAVAHREIAMQLVSTANQMNDYQDLPMGTHSKRAMSDPKVVLSFQKLMKVEQELDALLQKRKQENQKILATMNIDMEHWL